MDKKDWPIIDTSDLNQDAVREFEENEKAIRRLDRIPKKRITFEQHKELITRVRNRPNIVRRFRQKEES